MSDSNPEHQLAVAKKLRAARKQAKLFQREIGISLGRHRGDGIHH